MAYLITGEEALEKVKQFEQTTLPKEEWTHEMHLIVALYVILTYKSESLSIMKSWIWRYNEAVGKGNEGTGYHETLTVFWLWRVKQFIDSEGITAFDSESLDLLLCDELLAQRKQVEDYYDFFVLLSPAARRTFKYPNFQDMVGVEYFLKDYVSN